MKYFVLVLLVAVFFGCKEAPKEDKSTILNEAEMVSEPPRYSAALQKVFTAHGGLDAWKNKKTLIYEMPKQAATEIHTIDLYSRKDRIDTPNFSMGYDGKEVWLLDENNTYEGDPVFYHNLMFYFYAMPFVLADDGINYGEAQELVFEDKRYPGIRISYDSGIGTSPKDEYFMHYDPDTSQMAWLGYTVTYRSGEKSDNIKWILYNDWMEVDDLILPKSITWHAYEGRNIKEAKNTVSFDNVRLSTGSEPDSVYKKPEKAILVKGKKH